MSDARPRSLEELRNNAQGLLYTTEQACKEYGRAIPADLQAAIQAMRAALSGDDREALEAALFDLEGTAYLLAESLFDISHQGHFGRLRWAKSSKARGPRLAPQGFQFCDACGGSGICVACDGNGTLAGLCCWNCEGREDCTGCLGVGHIRSKEPESR